MSTLSGIWNALVVFVSLVACLIKVSSLLLKRMSEVSQLAANAQASQKAKNHSRIFLPTSRRRFHV